jgi:hypothetical protein
LLAGWFECRADHAITCTDMDFVAAPVTTIDLDDLVCLEA